MLLEELNLKNFRNLNLSFIPSSRLNVVIGKNGCGKSNFLDSIFLLSFGKSFKQSQVQNNICFNADFANIEAGIRGETSAHLKILFSQVEATKEFRVYQLNGKATIRQSLLEKLPVVIFSPYSMNFVSGEPEIRRTEIDDFLSLCRPDYLSLQTEYSKVVRNRNKLLQRIFLHKAKVVELDFWDDKLISIGSRLIATRVKYLAEVVVQMQRYNKLGIVLGFDYESSVEVEGDINENFSTAVLAARDKDLTLQQTTVGPHRDDYSISFANQPIKVFGSRGQQRMSVLTLKVAVWQVVANAVNIVPILLFDDALSELDQENRERFETMLTSIEGQIFLTVIEKTSLTKKLLTEAKILELE